MYVASEHQGHASSQGCSEPSNYRLLRVVACGLGPNVLQPISHITAADQFARFRLKQQIDIEVKLCIRIVLNDHSDGLLLAQ